MSEIVDQARYIEVSAHVRYWEDARMNGIADTDGRIPLRNGDMWELEIELANGLILGWPEGTEADVHYKVCDAGLYWLLDENRGRIAKWSGHYVPSSILCVGADGWGDYIIFKVGQDGKVTGWQPPRLDADQWVSA